MLLHRIEPFAQILCLCFALFGVELFGVLDEVSIALMNSQALFLVLDFRVGQQLQLLRAEGRRCRRRAGLRGLRRRQLPNSRA
nr:hypothetical protein [Pseudomonas mendocina]